ncbi:hypothetical protein ACJW30_03G082200 [Castanea mollissima]
MSNPSASEKNSTIQSRSAPVPWSTGLCDCSEDVPNCCITWLCPCITFGRIAEIVDRGSSSCAASKAMYKLISILTSCGCLYLCFYRSKLRQQYTLEEKPCGDCLVHWWCEPCALCQEYRELKSRGFDMAIDKICTRRMYRKKKEEKKIDQNPDYIPHEYSRTLPLSPN